MNGDQIPTTFFVAGSVVGFDYEDITSGDITHRTGIVQHVRPNAINQRVLTLDVGGSFRSFKLCRMFNVQIVGG